MAFDIKDCALQRILDDLDDLASQQNMSYRKSQVIRDAAAIIKGLAREKKDSRKTHEIKIREEFADAVLNGDKTFELRENDRGYQKGDFVKFTVLDRLNVPYVSHKLHDEIYEITYVLNGWGLEPNKVAFSIRKVSNVK